MFYNVGFLFDWVSLVAQSAKRLPATWETWVQSLGQEDPLEKEMATHSSILAWRNSMDRGAWWATVHGVTESRTQMSTFIFIWSLKDLEKLGSRETCLIPTQPFPDI